MNIEHQQPKYQNGASDHSIIQHFTTSRNRILSLYTLKFFEHIPCGLRGSSKEEPFQDYRTNRACCSAVQEHN